MNDPGKFGSAEMLAAREVSRQSIAFGAVLTVLGIFAVMAPMFTGIGVTMLVGLLLVSGGIVEIVFAFRADSFGKGVLRFLFGGLGALAGLVIVATPATSLTVLTTVLAALFLVGGVIDFVLALKVRPEEGWGWMLFGGVVSVALGALIIAQWPVSGIWAVGLYVGVRMLTHGWMLMALGKSGRESLTHLQDARIEMLERHVREGARALQETQAAVADHTAMLFAVSNEMKQKVSTSEIDPSIRELNQKLGEARQRMQEATAAAKDSWNATQDEANVAFRKLRDSAAEIARRMKQEFGLEDHGGSPSDPAR